MRIRTKALLVAGSLAAASAGIVGITAASGRSPRNGEHLSGARALTQPLGATSRRRRLLQLLSAPPVDTVGRAIASHFAVLARPATGQDLPPLDLRSARAVSELIPGSGANPLLARRAIVRSDGDEFFVMPGKSSICMVDDEFTQHFCAPASYASSGAADAIDVCDTRLPPSTIDIAGFMPNGASRVSFVLADGATMPVVVQNNAYDVRVNRHSPLPVSIRFLLNGQARQVSANVPSDAGSTPCGADGSSPTP